MHAHKDFLIAITDLNPKPKPQTLDPKPPPPTIATTDPPASQPDSA